MIQEELEEILEKHKLWLNVREAIWPDVDKFKELRANFQNENFSGLDFSEADLTSAIFIGCNFLESKFIHADLESANFEKANLLVKRSGSI